MDGFFRRYNEKQNESIERKRDTMHIIIAENYADLSLRAANFAEEFLQSEPTALISFPGGDTPVGMLRLFAQRVRSGEIDVSAAKFVQLDDWVGLGPEDAGSCSNFIQTHLLEPMGKPFADCFLFDGKAADIDEQLALQDAFVHKYGPIGLDVLGIGMNGHLGFNEDGADFSLRSHRTPLSPVTRGIQSKYFGGRELPLTEGITLGIAQIMESKAVLLLAGGAAKSEIVANALAGPVSRSVPASVLQHHPNFTCILDRAAAARLPKSLLG